MITRERHSCPIQGCATLVGAEHPLCAAHARIAPTDMRDRLQRSYNPHRAIDEQGPGFARELANLSSWIIATYGVQTERVKPSWSALKAATRRRDAERNARRGQPPPPSFEGAPTKRTDKTDDEPSPEQSASRGQMDLL